MGKESAPSQPAPQHSPSLGVPNLQHCHLKLPENRATLSLHARFLKIAFYGTKRWAGPGAQWDPPGVQGSYLYATRRQAASGRLGRWGQSHCSGGQTGLSRLP